MSAPRYVVEKRGPKRFAVIDTAATTAVGRCVNEYNLRRDAENLAAHMNRAKEARS